VLLVTLLTWFDRQGAALAARAALQWVPQRVDSAIGEQAMQLLDNERFTASKVDEVRQWELRKRFSDSAARHAPQTPFELEFRRMKHEAGFNAFALPGGTIVLLDGMAERLDDDEVMVVLGHELGHVAHRHALEGVMRSFGLLAVAGTALGDFSQMAATSVATLQGLRHQRDAEREADAFGARLTGAMGLPPAVMQSVWRKLQAEEQDKGADVVPPWLSTHPSTEERLREAARAPVQPRAQSAVSWPPRISRLPAHDPAQQAPTTQLPHRRTRRARRQAGVALRRAGEQLPTGVHRRALPAA